MEVVPASSSTTPTHLSILQLVDARLHRLIDVVECARSMVRSEIQPWLALILRFTSVTVSDSVTANVVLTPGLGASGIASEPLHEYTTQPGAVHVELEQNVPPVQSASVRHSKQVPSSRQKAAHPLAEHAEQTWSLVAVPTVLAYCVSAVHVVHNVQLPRLSVAVKLPAAHGGQVRLVVGLGAGVLT
jgi:hypothetical protein